MKKYILDPRFQQARCTRLFLLVGLKMNYTTLSVLDPVKFRLENSIELDHV